MRPARPERSKRRQRRLGRALVRGLALLSLSWVPTGCVERLLQVRSEPPGAAVYVNGEGVGATGPDGVLQHSFSFYGTVGVTLRAPGFLSHRELKALQPPWYQQFPIDFFSEFLVPWTIRDLHSVNIRLSPAPRDFDDARQSEMDRKAEALRQELSPAGS